MIKFIMKLISFAGFLPTPPPAHPPPPPGPPPPAHPPLNLISLHSLQEIIIEKFETLDEELGDALKKTF